MSAIACPKQMEYGPCGGVAFDGTCEVADHACTFLDIDTVRWAGVRTPDVSTTPRVSNPSLLDPEPVMPDRPALPAAARMRSRIAAGPIVVADLPARALDAASIRECAAVLTGTVDAVLAGDSPREREQFPPAYRAHLIRSAGLEVWAGLNCRDRNRVALAGELAGLADAGAAAVHCVTGDHTLTGDRPDAQPVFDLDATRLAALARAAGHLVSVAESPASPPVERRAARLVEKTRAGAELCFVNHAGGVDPVRAFIGSCRALAEHTVLGAAIGFIPCVPVVVDAGSAELLLSFTSLALPAGYLDGILAAPDARSAGIAAAVELSARFLELDGVVGVNLSGGGALGEELAVADALAEIGSAVLA